MNIYLPAYCNLKHRFQLEFGACSIVPGASVASTLAEESLSNTLNTKGVCNQDQDRLARRFDMIMVFEPRIACTFRMRAA
uniref:HDC18180 n=1 Tax=Drosophila melanogaster TaxID=7227 RepID=Q6III2_DROME|nr:TPA_inf: HDC18180 [Drosophila melanogaster]